MPLFQKTVQEKYLKQLDKKLVQDAFLRFKTYFHNPDIQANIQDSKEEQFQEGFLRELFVNILGYTLNPNPDYNLTTEFKNEKGSKKADGAILKNKKAIGVIELKGTDTTDLAKIETQAFGYKNNQAECEYVITSNYEKLRFYIDNAIEHIEFNLFTITEKEFETLYLCLAHKNIENGIPKKIKQDSIGQEDKITKQLYNDYSLFKRELYRNLVILNPKYEPIELFKKSQKLLDRFLFLFFSEDRQLLPPNSVRLILNDWKELQERDAGIPLYERFKKYFEYLNTGYKGKRYEVFAYNGGLFKPDEVLDTLKIDDDLLYKHTFKLSEYDFASEVDVNILGHIFENSLNELDEIKAQLEGKEIDKNKTKRKKDGVFYTPKYITKYIVENTVGKLCTEKKAELEITDEIYSNAKLRSRKRLDNLKAYRDWLLQIKICDPACGSGAFLNQALDFLINEHRYVDELSAKYNKDALVLSDIENSILENNLFGVDLNEESVEIAKLSLWLRTAKPNRKLNDLSNNIKCGNSLIDDPAVAGDKAFDWFKEFPQVFGAYQEHTATTKSKAKKEIAVDTKEEIEKDDIHPQGAFVEKKPITNVDYRITNTDDKITNAEEPTASYGTQTKSGFDVVIGNPPYVRQELLGEYKNYFSKNYKVFNFSGDLFGYFYEKAFLLLKQNGVFAFISNTFDKTTAGIDLRKFLISNVTFNKMIDFTQVQIFEGATTYPIILVAEKSNLNLIRNKFSYCKIPISANPKGIDIDFYNYVTVAQSSLDNNNWSFKSNKANLLLEKFQKHKTIRENFGKCYYGIKTALNDAFILKNNWENGEHIKPIYEGWEIKKWITQPANQKLVLFKSKWTKDFFGNKINEEEALEKLKKDYPEYITHLLKFEEKAKKRFDKGDFWWELRNCAYYDLFEKPKIIFPNLQNSNKFCIDEIGTFLNAPAVFLPTENKALLSILNSKLVWYFLSSICVVRSGGYLEVKPQYFEQIPIPDVDLNNKNPLGLKADLMLGLNKELQEVSQKFKNSLERRFDLKDLPRKLENWYLLSYKEFVKELGKKKIKISLSDEAEWEAYFNQESKKALDLKSKIDGTDKEIDQMVYKLYDLTPEEIRIIEESIK